MFATSIDALAAGFSLALIGVEILQPSLIIGVVAAVITIVGLASGRQVGAKFGKVAGIIGGLILIGLAVKGSIVGRYGTMLSRISHTVILLVTGLVITGSLLVACVATQQNPSVSVTGVPMALAEIPRWSVEIAPSSTGRNKDLNPIIYSGTVRKSLPGNLNEYLEKVKDRLISKHHIDLSENFPDHGYIVIELRGLEVDYVQTDEALVLDRKELIAGSSESPKRETRTKPVHSKTQSAVVSFYGNNGKGSGTSPYTMQRTQRS